MTDEEALALPKRDPRRFNHFYGGRPFRAYEGCERLGGVCDCDGRPCAEGAPLASH